MSTEEKFKYIIIDDHPLIRKGIKDQIEKSGAFELLAEFDSIRVALTEPMKVWPDIMILDLSLKDGDAMPNIPRLRSKFPNCRIVVYTQLDHLSRQLAAAGVNGYVNKKEESLLEAMHEVMKGNDYFTNSPEKPTQADTTDSRHFTIVNKFNTLTKRQLEVAELMRRQWDNDQIARKLFISPGTADTHRKAVKQKLGAGSKAELFEYLDYYFGTLKHSNWPDEML